jgi:hypothetical protein
VNTTQKTVKPLWRRVLKRLIQVAIALCVVLFLIWSIWQYVVTKQLRAEIENIPPRTFAQFNELYRQSTDADGSIDADDTPFNNAACYYKAALALAVMPDDIYIQINEAYKAYRKAPTANPPEQSVQHQAKTLLENNKHVFELLAMASSLENCSYGLEEHRDMGHLVDDMRKSRVVARLLSLRTTHHIINNKPDAAVSSILDTVKLLRVLDRQTLLVTYLVKISITKMICNDIHLFLQRSTLSDDQLISIHETVGNSERPHGLQHAMHGERMYVLRAMQPMLPSIDPPHPVNPIQRKLPDQLPSNAWLSLLLRQDILYLLRIHAKTIDAAGQPWPNQIEAINDIKPMGMFSGISMSGILATVIASGQGLATQRATRIAILIERYRLAHGDLPHTLHDLVPQLSDELPLDPFTGKAMLYHTDAEGYVVYSVGPNRSDDGGQVALQRKQDDADWGFRLYHHPQAQPSAGESPDTPATP